MSASDTPPVFRVRRLVKGYDGRTVLDGVDFDVAVGECLAILGRSGAGKSVLLRLLTGLERPDSGSIRFHDEEITALAERDLAPMRRRVGMLFQGGALFDSMNVADNIAFSLVEHRALAPEAIPGRVAELLGAVGLPGIESKMPADLSGGMRKRVALARALALDPEVVLYDEPTTGLDPMTSASIGRLMIDVRRGAGTSSVVVTHDVALARRVADRFAFLDQGRFRFVGDFDEAERSADPLLGAFLAGREEDADVA